MRVYLDMCCFNRPYDDQTQARIRLETEAKLLIQYKIKEGECHLLWSATLDFECSNNPYQAHRFAIEKWRSLAETVVVSTPEVIAQAQTLMRQGVGNYDALHVASALAGKAELFVTTDDRLFRKIQKHPDIKCMLPGNALAYLENWYED